MLAAGALALWLSMSSNAVSYSNDSANYIEQARSLLAGNGFLSRPHYTFYQEMDEFDAVLAPDLLFPPGYPAVIAASAFISGAPAEIAAIWVNKISLAILPLVIFLAFRSAIGFYGAICLGIIGAFSCDVVNRGQIAIADVLAFTLVIASFGLLLRAWSSSQIRRAVLAAFGAGLIAGYAYLTRNAVLALLLSVPLSLAGWFILASSDEKTRTLKVGVAWAAGVLLFALPWLVRNLLVFGEIQPYEMPPSTIGPWHNIQAFTDALITGVSGSRTLGDLAARTIPGLGALVLMAGLFIYQSLKHWPEFQQQEKKAFIAALSYAAVGSAMVIAARTTYQWGEEISDRHIMQYVVFMLTSVIILLRYVFSNHVWRNVSAFGAMSVWVVLMLIAFLTTSNKQEDPATLVLSQINIFRTQSSGPCVTVNRPVVVSNYAYLFRIVCDVHALRPGHSVKSISEAIARIESKMPQQPVFAAFYPGKGLDPSWFPVPATGVTWLNARGWAVLENSPSSLLLQSSRKY